MPPCHPLHIDTRLCRLLLAFVQISISSAYLSFGFTEVIVIGTSPSSFIIKVTELQSQLHILFFSMVATVYKRSNLFILLWNRTISPHYVSLTFIVDRVFFI